MALRIEAKHHDRIGEVAAAVSSTADAQEQDSDPAVFLALERLAGADDHLAEFLERRGGLRRAGLGFRGEDVPARPDELDGESGREDGEAAEEGKGIFSGSLFLCIKGEDYMLQFYNMRPALSNARLTVPAMRVIRK